MIEGLVAQGMKVVAEEMRILSSEQMGNRVERSTGLVARVVIETVRAVWKKRLTTSLLQPDLTGTFDNANHEWLTRHLEGAKAGHHEH